MLAVSNGGSDAYNIGSLIDRLQTSFSGTISKVPPLRCAYISVMISLMSGSRCVFPTRVDKASAYRKFLSTHMILVPVKMIMKPPRSKLRGIRRKGIGDETPRFLMLFPLYGNP